MARKQHGGERAGGSEAGRGVKAAPAAEPQRSSHGGLAPPGGPDAMAAAAARMEQSILDRRKALAHCGTCGAQGNWRTQHVEGAVRYLECKACGVGVIQIAVTEQEVAAALGHPARQGEAAASPAGQEKAGAEGGRR